MNNSARPAAHNTLRATRNFIRRILGVGMSREQVREDAGSYVGLFHGVIETDAPAGRISPSMPATAADSPKPPGRASGFLRLEVSDKKKATGCFLFFVDGEVLSGNIEGASEQTGFVEASFRLDTARTRESDRAVPRPVAAVGRLHLEARHARGAAAAGEDLTIRFV